MNQPDPRSSCSRCGARLPDPGAACPECGQPGGPESAPARQAAALERLRKRRSRGLTPGFTDRGGAVSLGIGIVGALVVMGMPFLDYIGTVLTILIHEIGHAATAWVFGAPSYPAFDLVYGGGIAVRMDRQASVVAAVYFGWLALAVWLWRGGHTGWFLAALAAGAAHVALSLTRGWEVMILFMGHGAELIFSGIFLYRALAGVAITTAAERPLYALLGCLLLFHATVFGHGLATDPAARAEYRAGKPNVDPDFVRIARDFLDVDVSSVAWVFLACVALVPLVVFGLVRRGVMQQVRDAA